MRGSAVVVPLLLSLNGCVGATLSFFCSGEYVHDPHAPAGLLTIVNVSQAPIERAFFTSGNAIMRCERDLLDGEPLAPGRRRVWVVDRAWYGAFFVEVSGVGYGAELVPVAVAERWRMTRDELFEALSPDSVVLVFDGRALTRRLGYDPPP